MVEFAAMAGERNPLQGLEHVIADRLKQMPEGSYTAKLVQEGMTFIAGKVVEETGEAIQALASETPQRVNEEIADVVYHLTVAMQVAKKGSWDGVFEELEKRRR